MRSDPFAAGQLPSTFPEADGLPAVQRLLAQQVDMQFADLRVLLRLPADELAPGIGCNLTAATMIFNQLSGFSVWFFHNPQAMRIRAKEKRGRTLSGQRFKSFVRAYYPRQIGIAEPSVDFIATRLYETRNVLSHSLGLGELKKGRRNKPIQLAKPDPALNAADIVDLELKPIFPLAGAPVRSRGLTTTLYIPGLYWATGRMLRAALSDQPDRCEAEAEEVLSYFPIPKAADQAEANR